MNSKIFLPALLGIISLLLIPDFAHSQTNISGTINQYTAVTAINAASCTAPGVVTVASSANYFVGDTVLLIQMQGVDPVTNNDNTFGNIQNLNHAGHHEIK